MCGRAGEMPVHGYGARTGASRIARGSNPSTVPVDPATWSAIEIAICVFRNFSIMVKLRFSTFAFFANLQISKFAFSLRDYGWGKTRNSVGL